MAWAYMSQDMGLCSPTSRVALYTILISCLPSSLVIIIWDFSLREVRVLLQEVQIFHLWYYTLVVSISYLRHIDIVLAVFCYNFSKITCATMLYQCQHPYSYLYPYPYLYPCLGFLVLLQSHLIKMRWSIECKSTKRRRPRQFYLKWQCAQ